jgi:hypothetical protein
LQSFQEEVVVSLRTRFLFEVLVRDSVIVTLLIAVVLPWSGDALQEIPTAHQGSVLAMLGFLMTAAIVGAFELTYPKIDIRHGVARGIAHATKFFLHLAIGLLIIVALGAMGITRGYYADPLALAALLIFLALFLHDFGDAVVAAARLQ